MLSVLGLAIAAAIGFGLLGFFSTLFAGWFIVGHARAAKQHRPA